MGPTKGTSTKPTDPSGEPSGTSSSSKNCPDQEKFLFDCDHLIGFCTWFEQTDIADQTDSVLEVKLEDLENRWQRLQTSYENLMLSPKPDSSKDVRENAKLNFNASSEAYYTARSHILDILRISRGYSRENTRHSLVPNYFPQNQPTVQNSSQDVPNSCIKVPPCDTEVFNGGYEEWPSFRDMFTAVYVNHPKLTRAQKLYHLRNKTRGPAGAIVKRYTLCDENFEIAWNALRGRYENQRVLVDNQIKVLFNIPQATAENSQSIQQIHSAVNDCLCTLKTLNVDIGSWDPILVYLVSTKLPDETLALWEQSLRSHRDLPTWNQLDEFLTNRFEIVERISSIKATKSKGPSISQKSGVVQTFHSQDKLNTTCPLCNNAHTLRTCHKFRKFSVQQRIDYVYKQKMCINCLSPSHLKNSCKSTNSCFVCHKPHHSLLHLRGKNEQETNKVAVTSANRDNHTEISDSLVTHTSHNECPSTSNTESSAHIQANFSSNSDMILLRTALIQIEHNDKLVTVRALLDPGSQRTFISEKIRKRLQIPAKHAHFEIFGICNQHQVAEKKCEIIIVSEKYDVRFTVSAIVLPKVTKRIPSHSFEIEHNSDLIGLDLADPHFNRSSEIDVILGNDCEGFINLEGIKKNLCGNTSAYNTIFGWVLSGPIRTEIVQSFSTNVYESEDFSISKLLRNFWEQEEVPMAPLVSESDRFCEEFYAQTTTRNSEGRYVVRLPFKREFSESLFLGSSRFLSLAQFNRMEATLTKNPELEAQYFSVLNEYITLDHVEETSARELCCGGKFNSFYLPHHAVVRPEHKSTKVRIVFNASRKSKSGYSLNDVLHTGPTLQTDLTSVILNWRKYKYVFCGDIQKMYRQILLHPGDREFQRILFKPDQDGPVRDFRLKTVTFGVNCAPFLAIRTLRQLASDNEELYPRVAKVLRNETYVDDVLSGGFSVEETIKVRDELISVLNSAGFPLMKITANDRNLLSHLPQEALYDSNFLRFHEASSTKTLGVVWNALTDTFSYVVKSFQSHENMTKRMVLSAVAQLFDPAGWVAPVVIRSKILMQQLWLEGIDWDDVLSSDALSKWNNLVSDLEHIGHISIPRWLQYCPSDTIEIHGFCDASQSAMCACIYVRCKTSSPVVFSNLLLAKSKVAPLKPVCLPRLELNGAFLLARLVKFVISTFDFAISGVTLWTDSSIVLGWLSKPPWTWETYVANRTSQIHDLAPNAVWRHVSTQDNPADLGTRGCRPQDLVGNSFWFHGPRWLTNPPESWPGRNPLMVTDIGKRKDVQVLHERLDETDELDRFSSYSRALKVISYVFRFYNNCRSRIQAFHRDISPVLSQDEVNKTKQRLISLAQKRFYSEEYEYLDRSEPLPRKSALMCLNPFIDDHGVLRVNGRLTDSSLPYNERYPIILPGNSRLCHLYLVHLHQFLAHGECTLMCRMAQTEFYISRLKPRVKSIIHKCKTCIIYKQKRCHQIMAPLPPERCTITPPFHVTGIDFAGPFEIRNSSLRKSPLMKGYVRIFVCFSTKAVHLEPCSELSTAAFEAAFSRFVGRRGLPRRVVTDNGRNFLGASRKMLKEFRTFINGAEKDISQKYTSHGFEWQFIPPYAPHMGGLWEAAVKSFKHHFKRIAGSHRFTFEQFATVLARIEGVLNSRPISSVSEDPTDLTALTPGHFLKGAPIMALPEPVIQNLSLLNRWTKLKAIHRQFATRWKEDYLKALHKRYKWKNTTSNLKVGDLVVVMDDLLPPNDWKLGRVVQTHHGSDNNTRVADIKVSSGIVTRPIVKLCYLPLMDETS